MIQDKTVLCIVPARQGSKGLPGKNIKTMLGKPLIAYTLEAAQASQFIDRVVVSTDSEEIAGIARHFQADVPFLRPASLATDQCGTIAVLLHAIQWLETQENCSFDILVLLQVTSPLRTTKDIDSCITQLIKQKAHNIFSVTPSTKNPYFSMVELDDHGKVSLVKKGDFISRQSSPQVFDINGAVYAWWINILKEKKSLFCEKTILYPMPKEHSIDIDDETDFQIAEMLLKKIHLK